MEHRTANGKATIFYKYVIAFERAKGINNLDAIIIYLNGGNTIMIYEDYDEFKVRFDKWACR